MSMDPIRIEGFRGDRSRYPDIYYLDPDDEDYRLIAILVNDHVAYRPRRIGKSPGHLTLYTFDRDVQQCLEAYTLDALRVEFKSITAVGRALMTGLCQEIEVLLQFMGPWESADAEPSFSFQLSPDLAEWNRPWSPREHSETLQHLTLARGVPGLTFRIPRGQVTSFHFTSRARSFDHTLGEEIAHWTEIIRSIHEEATAHLLAAQHANSLVETFHFPPAIATACTQYLEYFVQFLADLGIQAEAEVQHKAAEVLFRVTPADGREVLERVREALDAYLHLPTDPSLALVPSSGQDPAVWELKAVVRHLRDRVEFQQDVLEARNERILAQADRIEALQLANFLLQQQATGEVRAIGLGGAAAGVGEDTEAIIPGVISVKDVEKGGVVVHSAEILRRLKRRFGRGE